jgi:hypothetical protein
LQGTAYPYIGGFAHTRDGRGAIQTLIGRYEGPAAMSWTKQAAYDEIHNAVYMGEKCNFTLKITLISTPRHIKLFLKLELKFEKTRKLMTFFADSRILVIA